MAVSAGSRMSTGGSRVRRVVRRVVRVARVVRVVRVVCCVCVQRGPILETDAVLHCSRLHSSCLLFQPLVAGGLACTSLRLPFISLAHIFLALRFGSPTRS